MEERLWRWPPTAGLRATYGSQHGIVHKPGKLRSRQRHGGKGGWTGHGFRGKDAGTSRRDTGAELAQRLGRTRAHNENRAYKEGRQKEQGLAATKLNERMKEHPRVSNDSTQGHWSNRGREPAQNIRRKPK